MAAASPTLAETLVAIAASALFTVGLVWIATRASGDHLLSLARLAFARSDLGRAQGRLALGLAALGVVIGVPMSLGLMQANVFQLAGALTACLMGRAILSGEGLALPAALSFLALIWSIAALVLRFGVTDLGSASAAQAVLEPWGLSLAQGAVSGAAALSGVVAAMIWVWALPALPQHLDPLDRLLRAGEITLAASALAATGWGPSAGALLRGPLDARGLGLAGLSLAVTVAAVALLSLGRLAGAVLERPVVVGGALAVSLGALMAAWLAR